MKNNMTKDASKGFTKVVDLVEIAGSLKPLTAVMAGGERVEDLLLLESARDHGIIDRIVLVGRKHLISDAVARVGIDVPEEDILASDSDEGAAAVTAELVNTGVVQMVLKGSTPTHILHRHMLPLAVRDTVSLVSIFDAAPIANGRPMILTDAGVTTVCNYARIAGLIRNAVDIAHSVMEIKEPRVALLSANEKILPTLPSTQMGADFTRREWPDATVYGPLSLDLATDPRAVASKGLPDIHAAHEVAGQADILVCPGIDTGNVIYKMLSALIKYGEASLANIIMGFPKPYVLLSRSDALESRLNSVALGAIYAQRGLGEHSPSSGVVVPAKTTVHGDMVVNPDPTSTKITWDKNDPCIQEPADTTVNSRTVLRREKYKMTDTKKRHWVFHAHVQDRAGALTSIASAFSNEGISIDTIVGHGLEVQAGIDGSVVMTFWCNEHEKDIMVRKIRRLSKVTGLEEQLYESQNLRKSAIITTNRKLAPRDVAGEQTFLTCELVNKNANVYTYFLAGSPSELDPVLEQLEASGCVTDIVYSVIGL